MQRYRLFACVVLLAVPLGSAWSASVRLVPEAAAVSPGPVAVDLVLEAADVAAGCTPRCSDFAGEILVSFDESQLAFVGFTPASPTVLGTGPQTGPGSVTLGFEQGPETGRIGVFEFTVLAAPGETIAIGLDDAAPLLGSFEYAQPTNQFFFPAFQGAEVQVVPVPAAAWLFVSALAVVAARARRARS